MALCPTNEDDDRLRLHAVVRAPTLLTGENPVVESEPVAPNERVYFDTSAFNYLLNQLDYHVFLGTRDLQLHRGRQLLISPVVVWEVLLTPNERTNDFLVFSAQHLFAPSMLAAPSELLLRYLEFAYPDNKINYDIFTALSIGDVWRRMAGDPSRKFVFDPSAVQERATYIRSLGSNLGAIADYPSATITSEEIRLTAEVIAEVYEALARDGFLPGTIELYDRRRLYRLVVLFAFVLFALELDFDSAPMRGFWEKVGIPQSEMMPRLMYVFETYPALLIRGPLLEMAVMAYHHVQRGRRSRGAIFDSMHMVYMPYVTEIISADEDFRALRNADPRYRHRVRHVDEINLRPTLYPVD